jgi:ParB-like chromosome segregation protein Spo0J
VTNIAPSLRHLALPVADLRPHPDTPRRGDLAAIKESLGHHGQYRPIVVNRPTMEVLAGNHTLRGAQELGWTEVAARFPPHTPRAALGAARD